MKSTQGVPITMIDGTTLEGYVWTPEQLRRFRRRWLNWARTALTCASRATGDHRANYLRAVRDSLAHARRLTGKIASCE